MSECDMGCQPDWHKDGCAIYDTSATTDPTAGERAACRYVMHAPGDPCDCKARLAQVTTHTRTSTNGNGPDYCAECSAAISEWVPWPCTDAATPDAGDASEPLSERDDFCVCNASGPAMPGDAHEWACSLLWQRVLSREAAAATRARAEALRIVRLVEQDMADRALLAWRSADARVGLSDHDALLAHADALTRWSERLRMAFDGNDWRDDRADSLTPDTAGDS